MPDKLPAQTRMGRVALTVADLARSLAYYQDRLGLTLRQTDGKTAVLGTPTRDLLHLQAQPGAQPTRGTTGLYHFALLTSSRLALAQILRHLVDTDTPIDGAADHAVSEAIYLTDPDGHGIEIYRDRPRHEWQYVGGTLKMVTEPFAAQDVLGELNGRSHSWTSLDPKTVMGHVHLHIGHLQAALDFYTDVVGFDLVMRYGPSAGFVSAGGYHHHLGLNTWAGVGAPRPAADSAHLLWYEIVVEGETAVMELEKRLNSAGVTVARNGRSLHFQDPSGNQIRATWV